VHANLSVDDDIPERKVHTAECPIWKVHWEKRMTAVRRIVIVANLLQNNWLLIIQVDLNLT